MTQISVGGLGVTALDIHVKGQKHSLTCPAMGNSKLHSHHQRMKMETDE